jgi:tetratricopeptide (TPR) repeat protein
MKKIFTFSILLLMLSINIAAQNDSAEQELAKLNGQISQLAKEKRFFEALPVAKKAVELSKTKLGEKHLEYGKALHTLGYLYFVQNDKKESETALENALQVYEFNRDKNIENLLVGGLETLASIKYEKDKYEDAKKLLEKALIIREKLNGAQSAQAVSDKWSLANINYTIQKFDEAATLYRQVFDYRRTQTGLIGTEIFDAYTRCSCSMYKAGKRTEAEAFEDQFYEEVSNKRKFKKVDILKGFAIKIPEPKYPAVAGELKKGGKIDVYVVVNEKGDVAFSCAKTNQYYFGFVNAAEKAAYEAKFLPFFVNNEPVKAVGTITYIFEP